jgi:hypothetical protein
MESCWAWKSEERASIFQVVQRLRETASLHEEAQVNETVDPNAVIQSVLELKPAKEAWKEWNESPQRNEGKENTENREEEPEETKREEEKQNTTSYRTVESQEYRSPTRSRTSTASIQEDPKKRWVETYKRWQTKKVSTSA